MKKMFFLVLVLLSYGLCAKEFFGCDLSVNDKIIRSKKVEVEIRNLTIDMGTYGIYNFFGGVSGNYKYAWYWFDQINRRQVTVLPIDNPPAEVVAVNASGEFIKLTCDLSEE
jgi:hypothetical protein